MDCAAVKQGKTYPTPNCTEERKMEDLWFPFKNRFLLMKLARTFGNIVECTWLHKTNIRNLRHHQFEMNLNQIPFPGLMFGPRA